MTKDRSWRRYLPYEQWPAGHREAWEIATAPGNIIDGQGPAAHWAEATKRSGAHHYARWLAFMRRFGYLLEREPSEASVTIDAVGAYVEQLTSDVAPRTVVSSLVGLKVMMKAMAPHMDWTWLTDICNRLNRRMDPLPGKAAKLRDTGEIFAAAIAELEARSATALKRRIDRVAFRDALMLALMAARPLRLKNFAGIEIDQHLVLRGEAWWLSIPGEETKTGRSIEFPVPASLAPFLAIYLQRVRPSFRPDGSTRSLWLDFQGAPLAYHSIYCRFILVTKRLLSAPINPHLLRDCAASSLAVVSPAMARAAAPLLGHRSFVTTERHYIKARQLDAGRRINGILSSIKR